MLSKQISQLAKILPSALMSSFIHALDWTRPQQ